MHKEFTSPHELHDEEDLLLGLEDIAHTHEEGVVSLEQDVLLQLSGLYLVVLEDDVFAEGFHREHFPIGLLLDEEDFTEAAPTNDGDELEVVELNVGFVGVLDKGCDGFSVLLEVKIIV